MNEENSKKIWSYIQEAGDKLVDKLPPSKNHPRGRNPYAHVAICVKSKFSQSYKEIPNDIDGCWQYTSDVAIDKLDSVFLMRSRQAMKDKYGLDFFIANIIEMGSGLPFPKFFQTNRDGESKGILVITLGKAL